MFTFIGPSLRTLTLCAPSGLPLREFSDAHEEELQLLHLKEIQFNRGLPPKERHKDIYFALVRIYGVNHSDEVSEGAVGDPDAFALVEANTRHRSRGFHLP